MVQARIAGIEVRTGTAAGRLGTKKCTLADEKRNRGGPMFGFSAVS